MDTTTTPPVPAPAPAEAPVAASPIPSELASKFTLQQRKQLLMTASGGFLLLALLMYILWPTPQETRPSSAPTSAERAADEAARDLWQLPFVEKLRRVSQN